MLRVNVVVFAAAALLATTLIPQTADAAQRHRTHVTKVRVAAAPAPAYYGMPGSYYPAPPFPFFLIPGPWWLPAGAAQ
jgi:hypothetical protein